VERIAFLDVTQPPIEIRHRDLTMQDDFDKAPLRGDRGGTIHEPRSDTGSARRGAHRDATDLSGPLMLQHAKRADDLIIADGDEMGGVGVEFIHLELARHPLLVHEHLEAQLECVPHEVGPEFDFDDPFALHLNSINHESSYSKLATDSH